MVTNNPGFFADLVKGLMLLHSTLTLQTCLQRKVYRTSHPARNMLQNRGRRELYEYPGCVIGKRTEHWSSSLVAYSPRLKSVSVVEVYLL